MKFLKQLLSPALKQFLWFVFKSPQRKWIGYSSLFSDFLGWISTRGAGRPLQAISICIGVKNRSHHLLNYVIRSLKDCDHPDLIEISVYDCGSEDIENLEQAIQNVWKGKIRYKCQEQAFARSISFNAAVQQASHHLILVCDADMSLPTDIVAKVNRYTGKYAAWFPHVWYTNEDGSGRYYTESTGMMASSKKQFFEVGGYDESIVEWGKEDWLLFFAFYQKGIACIRSNERNFVHHYHPSLKPEGFVPLF